MNIEDLRLWCLEKAGVTESLPFGDDTLVFKVGTKMFLLANLDGPLWLNIKARPEHVIERLEHYPAAKPGYHMNKTHWFMVDPIGLGDDKLLLRWIDESYHLVLSGLPAKTRKEITETTPL